MRKLTLIGVIGGLILSAGCATGKSYFGSSTTIGLSIGVDESKIPTVRMGYIRAEGGALNAGSKARFDREFNDISLLTGKGSGKQSIEIETAQSAADKRRGQTSEASNQRPPRQQEEPAK